MLDMFLGPANSESNQNNAGITSGGSPKEQSEDGVGIDTGTLV